MARTSKVPARSNATALCRVAIGLSILLTAFQTIAGEFAETNRDENTTRFQIKRITPVTDPNLPNAIRVHERVISGGAPDAAGMQQLLKLGVKTIISVDGASPDVQLASTLGLRYVHLPHGYDEIPESRVLELAKAVKELPGPIYIHCHHGKHRSPAAAAAACVTAGYLEPQDATTLLRIAETGKGYQGLFASVHRAKPVDSETISSLSVEYRGQSDIPPLADAMVQMQQAFDRLKAFEAADWQPRESTPITLPPTEALLLAEHFRELGRTNEIESRSINFRKLIDEGEAAAVALQKLLEQDAADLDTRSKAMLRVNQNCQQCHQQFRDVPLAQIVN